MTDFEDKIVEGENLPTIEMLITQSKIDEYSVASGDFNPIHINQDFAKDTEFGSTIAHGMMVAATISESLAAAFDRNWLENGRLKLKFKSPVFPGDKISTFGKIDQVLMCGREKSVTCSIGIKKFNGEVVIVGNASLTIPV